MFKTKKDQTSPPDQERYTSGDVARIAGVSLRQLQWWDERNVVSPRPGRPPARLPAAGSGGGLGHRRTAAQGLFAAEDPPRAALPAEGNGQAPRATRWPATAISISSPTARTSIWKTSPAGSSTFSRTRNSPCSWSASPTSCGASSRSRIANRSSPKVRRPAARAAGSADPAPAPLALCPAAENASTVKVRDRAPNATAPDRTPTSIQRMNTA